ncbi:MAG: aldo/keto reductase, partial [Alistipes sp.]|nr:aldo/keto reductase [Alistipes sp.]
MKTLLSSLLLLSGLTFATGACSPADKSVENEKPAPVPAPEPAEGRALVVYFSCTNTTKGIADRIVEATGAAAWRIEPAETYTAADLNYNDSSSRANREQNDPAARPAINGK